MRKVRLASLAAVLLVCLAVGTASAQRDGDRDRPGGPGGFLRTLPVVAALDADKDGEISAKEIEQAVAALKTLDKNKDGKLSEEELRPSFAGSGGRRGVFGRPGGFGGGRGGPGGGAGGANAEAVVTRLMSYDKNKDGKLSKDELPERVQSVLTRADTNKDGFATKDELTKMAEKEAATDGGSPPRPGGGRGAFGGRGGPGGAFGGRPSSDQFVDRALRFDADKDGKLSKEELKKMAEQFGGGPGRPGGGRGGEGARPKRPQRPKGDE